MGRRAGTLGLVALATGLLAAVPAGAAAPLATIDSGPAAQTNQTSATFKFHAASGTAKFLCQVDGGGFASCDSPYSVMDLSEGAHTFDVKTTAAGDTAAKYSWTVDLTPPTTVVTQQPPALSNSRTSTFAFSSPDATATFRCTLNGSTPQTCVSPVVYTNLSDATRTLLIQAVDPAGNVDTQAQPIMWTVDATPPDTTLTPPTHYAANTEPTFSFSSSEAGSTFQCSLGLAAFAPCTSPDIVFVPRSGQHRFRVRAVDAAGNADPTPAVFKWTSDVTPPRRPRVFLFPAPVASASGVQPFPSGSPGLSLITTTPLQQIVIRPPLFTLATSLQAQWSSPDPTAVAYDAWVTTAADGLPASAGPVFKQLTDTTSKALKIRPGTGKSVCIHVDARDHLGNKSRVVVRCTTIPARVTPAPVVGRWVKSNGAWGGHYVQIALGHGYYVPSAIQGFPSPDFLAIVAEQCASCGTLKIGFAQNPTDPIQHLFRTLDLTGRQRRGNARPFIVRLPRARLRGLGSGVVLIIATSGKVRLSGIGVALAHE